LLVVVAVDQVLLLHQVLVEQVVIEKQNLQSLLIQQVL
jgi:hypothetical protein